MVVEFCLFLVFYETGTHVCFDRLKLTKWQTRHLSIGGIIIANIYQNKYKNSEKHFL